MKRNPHLIEATRLLERLDDALLLVGPDLRIRAAFTESARALAARLGDRHDLVGAPLADVLRPLLAPQACRPLLTHLQALTEDPSEAPEVLRAIEGAASAAMRAAGQTRFYDITLRPFIADDGASLLLGIRDVTPRLQLLRATESTREAHALALAVLRASPAVLRGFLADALSSITLLQSLLRVPARADAAYRDKLSRLQDEVLLVQERASRVPLEPVVAHAAKVLSSLQRIANAAVADGDEFLPVAVELDALFCQITTCARLADQRGDFVAPAMGAPTSEGVPEPEPEPEPEVVTAPTAELEATLEPVPPAEPAEPVAATGPEATTTGLDPAAGPEPEVAPEPEPEPEPELVAEPVAPVTVEVELTRPGLAPVIESLLGPDALPEIRGMSGTTTTAAIEMVTWPSRHASRLAALLEESTAGGGAVARLSAVNLEAIPLGYRRNIEHILQELVRNAAEHGIETQDSRLAVGKPPVGAVVVECVDRGRAGIEVTVRDDGRGLDVALIGQLAVDRGLVTADSLTNADARTVAGLIFRPGFAATGMAKVPGRGLGLEFLRELVMRMDGRITVTSKPGIYTRFRVQLPPEGDIERSGSIVTTASDSGHLTTGY
ncbi:MAG: hypothetical protein RL026_34 [Pseudomonadota bacterium]